MDHDPPSPARRRLCAAAAVLAATFAPGAAQAIGNSVDVTLVDRDAGSVLPVYAYRGRHFVAGRPGARYAIRISNRGSERVLAVMSVDGINIITGQTADWQQGGYVLAPGQSYDITGWRKSDQEVAAFEFTALPDSYAALTGRPNDVGVIGVAVFDERIVRLPPPAPPVLNRLEAPRAESRADSAERAAKSALAEQAQRAERLGTGHGPRETSRVQSTSFVRASSTPAEIVSLAYDRFENLVRAGVIPQYGLAEPNSNPFPRAPRHAGYVPDPPPR